MTFYVGWTESDKIIINPDSEEAIKDLRRLFEIGVVELHLEITCVNGDVASFSAQGTSEKPNTQILAGDDDVESLPPPPGQ